MNSQSTINNSQCTNRVREDPPNNNGPPGEPSAWRELRSLGVRAALIVAAAVIVFTFVYGLHYNMGPGMYPAVKDGDLVMYSRLDKDYKARDLLLLEYQGQREVRRVVATAGDTVDIGEDGLMINGAVQQERDICQKTGRYAEGIEFPVTLKDGEVFVLADAREDATDSRIYGPVDAGDTLGKVININRRRNL